MYDWELTGRFVLMFSLLSVSLWRMSRCVQRMSPMKSGALDTNCSLLRLHSSRPVRLYTKLSRLAPYKLNSLTAQLIQWATWSLLQPRGSLAMPSRLLCLSQLPYVVFSTSGKM